MGVGEGVIVGVDVGAGEGVTVIVEVGGMSVFVAGAVEHELNRKTNMIRVAKKLIILFFMFVAPSYTYQNADVKPACSVRTKVLPQYVEALRADRRVGF
jgi:hypothetical protein